MSVWTGGFGQGDIIQRQVELLFHYGGRAAVAQLDADIVKINSDLEAMAKAQAAGAITSKEFDEKSKALGRTLMELEQIQRLLNDAWKTGGVASQQAQLGTNALSRAALEFSRGMEDFTTAGPIGALNNIPTMFFNIGRAIQSINPELGLTMGHINAFTTAVSLLATAIYAVYKNWDLFMDVLGETQIKHAADEIDRLNKLKDKTIAQETELLRLKQLQSDAERATKAASEEQQERLADVTKAMAASGRGAETGGTLIQRAITQQIMGQAGKFRELVGEEAVKELRELREWKEGDEESLIGIRAAARGYVTPAGRERYRQMRMAEIGDQFEKSARDEADRMISAGMRSEAGLQNLIQTVGGLGEQYAPTYTRLISATKAERERKLRDQTAVERQEMAQKQNEDYDKERERQNQAGAAMDLMIHNKDVAAQKHAEGEQKRAANAASAAQRKHEAEVNKLARGAMGAAQGPGMELTNAIRMMLNQGQTMEDMLGMLGPQVAMRLQGMRTIPGAMRDEVARAMIRQTIEKQEPKVVSGIAGMEEVKKAQHDLTKANADAKRFERATSEEARNLLRMNYGPMMGEKLFPHVNREMLQLMRQGNDAQWAFGQGLNLALTEIANLKARTHGNAHMARQTLQRSKALRLNQWGVPGFQ